MTTVLIVLLILWLIFLAAFFAYKLGRARGEEIVDQRVADTFGPLLPALEELVGRAERFGVAQTEQAEALRKVATWN